MNDLYLILHKVRGEPTFDIAERMSVDGEGWWIIPTSGHRAHPMFEWRLGEVLESHVMKAYFHIPNLPRWHDLPDHYQAAVRHRHTDTTKSSGSFTADDL